MKYFISRQHCCEIFLIFNAGNNFLLPEMRHHENSTTIAAVAMATDAVAMATCERRVSSIQTAAAHFYLRIAWTYLYPGSVHSCHKMFSK